MNKTFFLKTFLPALLLVLPSCLMNFNLDAHTHMRQSYPCFFMKSAKYIICCSHTRGVDDIRC